MAVVSWMLGHPRGVIGIAPTLLDLMMAVPAFALVRDYRHAPPGRRRDTYLLVSLGFFAPAACSCLIAGALLQLRGATPRPADPSLFNYLEMGFFGVWFIVVSALLGFVAMQAVRARVERQRRDAALFGLIVVVSTISGAIAGSLPDVAASITAIGVMVAGWSTLGAALVGWGILRYSLFDIDIKLKASLQRSTVAAVFVAVYFLVSEVGAVWFSDVSGSDYWGIAAAALLLLALHPLQGATERVFDGLMPAARPLGSLNRDQQVAFYREQVDLMWMDGHLSPKDRLVLANLRVRLGLDTETAEAVELAVIAAQQA